jgi:NTP pyrophosphatase (non-canonical NTP hydrolase)
VNPDAAAEPPSDLEDLRRRIRAFADARDWEQFHTPKNLVMALAVEAAELMEPLQWLTSEQAAAGEIDEATRVALEDEIADVAIYLIRLADVLGVDLGEAVRGKLDRNEGRYPAEVVRGRARGEAG